MQRSIILALLLALLAVCFNAAEAKKKGPKITAKVYFDITIDGKEAGIRLINRAISVHKLAVHLYLIVCCTLMRLIQRIMQITI
jgi:hypothetical protein